MVEARRPVERVRGTQDSWPAEARQLAAVRRHLERTYASYGYQRIDVPVLELAELHLRKSGLDIISKLYAFDDQGGRRLCLRPELTASVVRAFVAQPSARLPLKVFSAGPVFRYERPSRGRYRQFTQSGVELLGAEGPLADAEMVTLAIEALDGLGLAEYRVTIGHVGVLGSMLASLGLTGRLRSFLLESLEDARRHGLDSVRARLRELDPELYEGAVLDLPGLAGSSVGDDELEVGSSTTRQAAHALLHEFGAEAIGRRRRDDIVDRVLRKLSGQSSADAVERALDFIGRLGALHGAPGETLAAGRQLLAEHGLAERALDELERTLAMLVELGAKPGRIEVDLGLSRGLQYYTGMVFEIDHAGLGSESQLCGGGRYDDLVRALGGRQAVSALGFAFGVERVRLALEAEGKTVPAGEATPVLVVPATPGCAAAAGLAARMLRQAGVAASLDVAGRPLRAGLAYADREGFQTVAIVGEDEATQRTVRLRDMASGHEQTVSLADSAQLRAALQVAVVAPKAVKAVKAVTPASSEDGTSARHPRSVAGRSSRGER